MTGDAFGGDGVGRLSDLLPDPTRDAGGPAPGRSARLSGRMDDVTAEAGYAEHPPRVGFFTDTSVCIGCKACEVACKEWNLVPEGEHGLELTGDSYDNTGDLGANAWRHVAFVEQRVVERGTSETASATGSDAQQVPRERVEAAAAAGVAQTPDPAAGQARVDLGMPGPGPPGPEAGAPEMRWLMSSDVCKHCTHAACLDVCPTGALFRTEFGTVVVQQDVCNGCGYCVPACPYGVIDQRKDDGRVFKCTLCYDRLGDGLQPACAKACPTDSIQFGDLDELQARADARLAELQGAGVTEARLYGRDEDDGVGGAGAFFLLLDEPEVYGLPPDPVVTTRDLPSMWRHAGAAAATLAAGVAAAFLGGRR